MRYLLSSLCCIALLSGCSTYTGSKELAPATTVYLIRHAEKDLTTKQDPALTTDGARRAAQLAELLQHETITAVYSTNTKRTRDTAAPIAAANSIGVTLYEVGDLAAVIAKRHAGESIVVIGHSNTVPRLVNALIGENRYPDLDDKTDYSSVFIVDLIGNKKSSKRLFVPLAAEELQNVGWN